MVTQATDQLLSIGEVAEATAISPATIRVWERRYGRPRPVRLPSGHRRYHATEVRRLRCVAEAVAHGHRPSAVAALDEDELGELLRGGMALERSDESLSRHVELIRSYQDEELRIALRVEMALHGPRSFLSDTAAPLLRLVGRLWADGQLEIRHEHFTTEIVTDLVRQIRESHEPAAKAAVLLFATLPGEMHGIGLQMAAAMAALSDIRPSILGIDVPVPEIVAATEDSGAKAVCVSVSLANGGPATDRLLAELRSELPPEVELMVGGAGSRGIRRGPRGITWLNHLNHFEALLRERYSSSSV
jgi:MerR family transcriptional regulator, light-induced transcriptional regulator